MILEKKTGNAALLLPGRQRTVAARAAGPEPPWRKTARVI